MPVLPAAAIQPTRYSGLVVVAAFAVVYSCKSPLYAAPFESSENRGVPSSSSWPLKRPRNRRMPAPSASVTRERETSPVDNVHPLGGDLCCADPVPLRSSGGAPQAPRFERLRGPATATQITRGWRTSRQELYKKAPHSKFWKEQLDDCIKYERQYAEYQEHVKPWYEQCELTCVAPKY